MRSTKRVTDFWVGLSFYLEQSQLSIHRSTWSDFKQYVKADKYDIDKIISTLTSITNLEVDKIELTSRPKDRLLSRLFSRSNYLNDSELNYVSFWVNKLNELLKSETNPTEQEVGKLRLNLAYAAGILYSRFPAARKENAPIAHLNQNERLKTKTIADILDFDWP